MFGISYSKRCWIAIFVVVVPVLISNFFHNDRRDPLSAPKSHFDLVPRVEDFGSNITRNGIDIVFVHGQGSNPDGAWAASVPSSPGYNKTEVRWITDFLPEDIPKHIRDDLRIFFYNHDTYYWKNAARTRISTNGNDLAQRLAAARERTKEGQYRKVMFVGHSYGGLIIKTAYDEANTNKELRNIADNTIGMIFLGTPHFGSPWSKCMTAVVYVFTFFGSYPRPVWELEENSPYLIDLNDRFIKTINDKIIIDNYYESRRSNILGLFKTMIVPEKNAIIQSAGIRNMHLDENHSGLSRFATKSGSYLRVLDSLLKPINRHWSLRAPHYSVPIEIYGNYIDRPIISSAIEKKMGIVHEESSVPYALAIYGTAGMGKTQLALNFVRNHKQDFDLILWIDASSMESTFSSFRRCANALGLPFDEAQHLVTYLHDSEPVIAVLDYIKSRTESDGKWLFVFNNANDFTWDVKRLIPRGASGSIIITSWDGLSTNLIDGDVEELHVDVMSPKEARELLYRHLYRRPKIGPQRSLDALPGQIEKACDELTRELGYFPLAVDLVGVIIGNKRNSYPEDGLVQFLGDFPRHKPEILGNKRFHGLLPTQYTVMTVWNAVFEQLSQQYADQQPNLLLSFLAHFKGNIIQDELFRLAALGNVTISHALKEGITDELRSFLSLNKGKWDSFAFEQTRDLLVQYGLLYREAGEWPGVTMHNLIQWRALQELQDRPLKRWYRTFVLSACYQVLQEPNLSGFILDLILHLPDSDDIHLDTNGNTAGHEGFIENTLAAIYNNAGLFDEAERVATKVKDVRELVLGPYDRDTLKARMNVAGIMFNRDHVEEASEISYRLLALMERILGVEDPLTLENAVLLLRCYLRQAKWKDLESLESITSKHISRVLGPTHPLALTASHILVHAYNSQYRLHEAELLGMELLENSLKVQGNHLSTIAIMRDVGITYSRLARWSDAQRIASDAYSLSLKHLGPYHLSTLVQMHQLMNINLSQGQWKLAELLGVQLNKTIVMAFGEIELALVTRDALVLAYIRQGYWELAERLALKMEAKRSRSGGETHRATLITRSHLHEIYNGQQRWEEAESLGVRLVGSSAAMLGMRDEITITSMYNLMETYRGQERWKDVEHMNIRLLEASAELVGDSHPATLVLMSELQLLYRTQGRWEEAESLGARVNQLQGSTDMVRWYVPLWQRV